MADVLLDVNAQWRTLAASRNGQVTLGRWQRAEPMLRSFNNLEQLAIAARGLGRSTADLDHRDDIQRALYRLAQTDADAQLTVLWLIFPALRRAAGDYVGVWTFEEAAAIAVAAAIDRMVRFPHESLRPAPCTIRWVRRALGREAMFARRCQAEVHRSDEGVQLIAESTPHPSHELLDLVAGALRDGYLQPSGAQLIIDHRIRGARTAEVAAGAGYPAATIRQRRNRAEAQLASWARQAA